jgi:diguanylate cyclase (GGDEF)-like protein/PAS domain S-box-containing protein
MATTSFTAGDRVSAADRAAEIVLTGHPGPALVTDSDGCPHRINARGEAVAALLREGRGRAIVELIDAAARHGGPVAGDITMPVPSPSGSGETVLSTTVVPLAGEGRYLVLGRDLSLDRNLRDALIDSRQRYKDLVEVSSDFAWEVGVDGAFVFVSPGGGLGFDADDLVGSRPEAFFPSLEDDDEVSPFTARAPINQEELWLRCADGREICVEVSCLPTFDQDGDYRGTRGVCRDVTGHRNRDQALNRAFVRERLLHRIVTSIRDELEPADMLTTAASTIARALGAEACRIYRLDGEGRTIRAAEYGTVVHSESLDSLVAELDAAAEPVAVAIGEAAVLAAPTSYRRQVNGALVMVRAGDRGGWSDEDRTLVGDVATQLGIANQQLVNHERIVRLSRTDALTGLFNRRAFFEEEVPRRIRRLEADGTKAALIYVDLDNFKMVNDVHGHQRGDDALLRLRDLLLEQTRPGDAIARLGGDEFALWLDGMNERVASARARKILTASQVLEGFSGSAERPLGVSLGVAVFDPASGETLSDLLARADAAMYGVKHGGKGDFAIAPPAGNRPVGAGAS